MKALVATVNYLLAVDLESGKVNIIEANRPEYYGISWWENSDFFVLSHSGLANDSLLSVESYINSEKGYLSFGKTQTQYFLSQPHQIICAPNNWVIATNTGRNCISLYDPNNGFHKDIRINDIHWDRLGKDNTCGEHFNSVFLKNDRLYVLAHRFKKNSHVLEFSYPDCTLLERYEIKQRSGLHNIWVDDDGNMIACHSDAGELIEVKTNETIWASGSSYYSRGLAATKDIIIVGDSVITTRENRKTSPSELWIIDRKTLNTLDYLSLGPFGSVHEVRIIDVPDEAHHGKIFNGPDIIDQLSKVQTEHRKKILKQNQEWQTSRQDLRNFNCVINGWTMENGWIMPKNQGFTLSLAKELPTNNFTASLDYTFIESSTLPNQHLSLIVGYRGIDDNNMHAILISYSGGINASIALWTNTDGIWESKELLFPIVPKEGKLSIQRVGNQLTIICSQLPSLIRKFDSQQLDGSVGVRCLGGQFRNFDLCLSDEKIKKPGIKEKIKAIFEKEGI